MLTAHERWRLAHTASPTSSRTAPYAPIANVLTVITRIRQGQVPPTLTVADLIRLGVPEGNAPRTLQTLRFLGLAEEDGSHTELVARLERVPEAQYQEFLAEVLRGAYADVFKVINPATSTGVQINDAFRGYQPSRQRDRMITLFLGLC